jgi:hypothetical protein
MPPQAIYLFKHALVQDAAYQSLLRSTRQQHHQRIALVLAARFPETVETQPELLAHHYTETGLTEQAIPYWQRAGQLAFERSAHLEAISHLTTGIELLKPLPETPERIQHALTMYIALGAALQMVKGYAAPEVEHAYTQAKEADINVVEHDNVLEPIWAKFLVVCGGAVCALARKAVGEVAKVPELRTLASDGCGRSHHTGQCQGPLVRASVCGKD